MADQGPHAPNAGHPAEPGHQQGCRPSLPAADAQVQARPPRPPRGTQACGCGWTGGGLAALLGHLPEKRSYSKFVAPG